MHFENYRYKINFFWRKSLQWAMASSLTRFLDHAQRRITFVRTPLDKWSARGRDLYLTTHNTHNQTNIHAPCGIRTHNLSRWAAANLRLSPRGLNKFWLNVHYILRGRLKWSTAPGRRKFVRQKFNGFSELTRES